MRKLALLAGLGLALLLLVLAGEQRARSAVAPAPARLAPPEGVPHVPPPPLDLPAPSERTPLGAAPPEEPRAAGAPREEGESAEPVLFHGRLVDATTGRPIAGGRAVLRRGGNDVPLQAELVDAVSSDGEGLFSLPLPGDGTSLELAWALAAGYGTAAFFADGEHRDPELAERIELSPGAALAITVLDAACAGVADVPVALTWPRITAHRQDLLVVVPSRSLSMRTAADGRASFEDLPAELPLTWSVAPDEGRPRSDRVALAPGEGRSVTVELGGGARLRGTVRDQDATAVGEVEIWVRRPDGNERFLPRHELLASTRADAQGRFELTDLPLEPLVLGPAPEQGDLLPTAVPVLVDAREMELDLVVERGRFLEGRVLDAGSSRRWEVWATPVEGGEAIGASTGEEGFRVGPLAHGEYLVQASSSMSYATDAVRAPAGARDVELRPARTRQIPVRVEGASGPYELQITHLEVPLGAATFLGGKGISWTFAPGAHSIAAFGDGAIAFLPRVEIGPREPERIVLRMGPSASLTVLHRAASGTRELRLSVDGARLPFPVDAGSARSMIAGSASTLPVPAGPLRAELLEGEAVVASAELVLAAGERRRVVLEVP